MFRSSKFKTIVVDLFALVGMFAIAMSARADGKAKKFKIIGVGVAPQALPLPGQDPRPHWIVGEASQLGFHIGAGQLRPIPQSPTSKRKSLPESLVVENRLSSSVARETNSFATMDERNLVPASQEPSS